jgi:hypothetical protein
VAHVLSVAAFEIGDPIADVVLMESDDVTVSFVVGRGLIWHSVAPT